MENLPHDVALDILSRLPITTLIQIKCVCKSWRALAQHPRLPSMHHARAYTRNPCLILHCDFLIPNELYFVTLGNRTEQHNSELRRINTRINSAVTEYRVVSSCNGVLCISNTLHFDPIFACNPFAGYLMELPKPFKYPDQKVALGFGYHPTTEKYKLVRITYYIKTHHTARVISCSYKSDVQVLTLGDDSWRSLGPVSIPWRVDPGTSEVLLNGALHWLTKCYDRYPFVCLQIISFDLAEENFRQIERPTCGSLDACNYHLVVLRGCLSAVHCLDDDEQIEIWIMKEYNVKESWSKDYVIRTTYLPTSLSKNSLQNSKIRKTMLGRAIKVVCGLKDGEILLEYENRTLVLYNPEREEFQDVLSSGLPKYFRTITHVESLLTVQDILKCKHQVQQ
ncbi:F-box protein [Melia azedarach]|uniref:F-box protein n=1 Tax=Melia azedarach TaxID=155640 RepID=A0ACC1X0N2_MELAZ|nr:F-box protein [Melia azedarach]